VIADTTLTRVMDDLAANPGTTAEQVAKRLRRPYLAVLAVLGRLDTSGRVQWTRTGYEPLVWEVTPRG
jgi:hypothetical protein